MNSLIKEILTPKNIIFVSGRNLETKTVTISVILESVEARDPYCLLPDWVKFDNVNNDMRGSISFDGTNDSEKVAALVDCRFIADNIRAFGLEIENQLAAAIKSAEEKKLM